MILIDTSVMVGFLKDQKTTAIRKFREVQEKGMTWGISAFTYHEILRGAYDEKEFFRLREYLDTQTIYHLDQHQESQAGAAMLFLRCRKSGYTVKSIVDCLIAQTAIEHGLHLLHQDRDFDALARIDKRIRIL